MIQDVDSDVLYVQRFSDYMINVSATYIINVSMSRIGRLKIRFKLKDRRCFLRKSFDRWSGGTSIFFLIIIFIKWEYQPKECSGPSAHSRDILLETFVPQKMLKKLQDLLRLVWTKNIRSSVTAGLYKKMWSQILGDRDRQRYRDTGFTVI